MSNDYKSIAKAVKLYSETLDDDFRDVQYGTDQEIWDKVSEGFIEWLKEQSNGTKRVKSKA